MCELKLISLHADLVKVAALIKAQKHNIIRSSWIHDCIVQHEVDLGRPRLLLPPEPRYSEQRAGCINNCLLFTVICSMF